MALHCLFASFTTVSLFLLVLFGFIFLLGFPRWSAVKNLPADSADAGAGWPLNWEDPLEKEKATPSSALAWEIPGTEEPGGLQSVVLQRVGHDWATKQQDFIVSWNPVKPFFKNFSLMCSFSLEEFHLCFITIMLIVFITSWPILIFGSKYFVKNLQLFSALYVICSRGRHYPLWYKPFVFYTCFLKNNFVIL